MITIKDERTISSKDFLETIIKLPPRANEVKIELKPVRINNVSSALGKIK
jgi:hypothetical protein